MIGASYGETKSTRSFFCDTIGKEVEKKKKKSRKLFSFKAFVSRRENRIFEFDDKESNRNKEKLVQVLAFLG